MFTELSKKPSDIVVAGLNFRTAPVELREKFAVQEANLDRALSCFASGLETDEVLLVNTCNRVEVVATVNSQKLTSLEHAVRRGFSEIYPEDLSESHFFHCIGREAVEHVLRLGAGLDSMVLGEPQILGQLKAAYDLATKHGRTGPITHKLFQRAFSTAKLIRTETGIGRNAVSVCYAAKELAKQIFADLSQNTVLLLGAGETGELALRHFVSAGCRERIIVNRGFDRAVRLAESFNGLPGRIEMLPTLLQRADIIIGCAYAGDGVIIDQQMAESARLNRDGGPQLYLDLGVPRNFDPAISDLSDTFLFDVDDLESVVKKNMDAREVEKEQAEIIVKEEADKFIHWLENRESEFVIGKIIEHSRTLGSQEVERTIKRLEKELGNGVELDRIRLALEQMNSSLVQKLFAKLVIRMKNDPSDEEKKGWLLELFGGLGGDDD